MKRTPTFNYLTPGWLLLLVGLLTGCSEYNAAEDVGYPTAWYVTVQLDDDSEQSVMLEELNSFSHDHPTAKGVKGWDRKSGEKLLIPLPKALELDPTSSLVVERHQGIISKSE
ncbi:MAG: hypothetical protein R3C11_25020 [Planctomycetaceae bacterium]